MANLSNEGTRQDFRIIIQWNGDRQFNKRALKVIVMKMCTELRRTDGYSDKFNTGRKYKELVRSKDCNDWNLKYTGENQQYIRGYRRMGQQSERQGSRNHPLRT